MELVMQGGYILVVGLKEISPLSYLTYYGKQKIPVF